METGIIGKGGVCDGAASILMIMMMRDNVFDSTLDFIVFEIGLNLRF